MKCIYVPAPILKTLKANKFEGRDFVDFNKLLGILSPEDLSFYIFTNLRPKVVLPDATARSFGNALIYGGITEEEPMREGGPWDYIDNQEVAKEVGRMVNDYCVEESAPQLNIQAMILSSEILWVKGGQLILFTHVEKADGDTRTVTDTEKAFYSRLLTQLNQYVSFEEIAKLPLFAGFLEVSARKLTEVVPK